MVYGYGCRQLAIAIAYNCCLALGSIAPGLLYPHSLYIVWNVLLVHNFSPDGSLMSPLHFVLRTFYVVFQILVYTSISPKHALALSPDI